jgi:hypothetical protein
VGTLPLDHGGRFSASIFSLSFSSVTWPALMTFTVLKGLNEECVWAENKPLRLNVGIYCVKIFGKCHNEELHNFHFSSDSSMKNKARRIRSASYVARGGELLRAQNILL